MPNPYLTRILAGQLSRFSRYYDSVIQLAPLPNDDGSLLKHVDNGVKSVVTSAGDITTEEGSRTAVLLNGNLNEDLDIEATLAAIRSRLTRLSRVAVVLDNPYFRGVFWLANQLGLRKGPVPSTFVTREALAALAKLSGYEVVQIKPAGYSPFRLLGLGDLINWTMPMIPLLRWLGFAAVVILRPVAATAPPSLSIVIPCRNEKGNIEAALQRLPAFPAPVEVIFIEGHSSDGTWQEVQRVTAAYGSRMAVSSYQQTGRGKSDAVRLGFSKAKHELVTILDADLTMPPEMLPRFYNAYCSGLADFVNGTRLVYPMEGEAMRFLNRLGNVFFAKALSFVLDSHLNDSLCGTKLLRRDDYARMVRWRGDFGDVDPFGDFELLFPAAIFGLGIVDVPVYYRARSYGSTNIHRFRHGFMLLRMTLIGLFRVKAGARLR
ncbi:MAG: glycosyltransferase family 2 protein [Cyanobacteria bacterium]|nr:glycosyltransferase family 2 protein [Cyanobacteriota bacterium]